MMLVDKETIARVHPNAYKVYVESGGNLGKAAFWQELESRLTAKPKEFIERFILRHLGAP